MNKLSKMFRFVGLFGFAVTGICTMYLAVSVTKDFVMDDIKKLLHR